MRESEESRNGCKSQNKSKSKHTLLQPHVWPPHDACRASCSPPSTCSRCDPCVDLGSCGGHGDHHVHVCLVVETTSIRTEGLSTIISTKGVWLGGLLAVLLLLLDLLDQPRPLVRGMIGQKGCKQNRLIRRYFLMGLGELLLPSAGTTQEGSLSCT